MTSEDGIPPDDVPEADLAEQRLPIDDPAGEDDLDLSHLAAATVTEADSADLIDQSRSVALPAEDDAWRR